MKTQVAVFIHEGAKSARFCADVAGGKIKRDDPALKHWPWFDVVQRAAHVGWVGGALRPHLTDWASLRKMGPQWIFIVADNDRVGKNAVPAIAKAIGLQCTMIAFTDQFPEHYDLADPVPAKFFVKRADGTDHYNGPTLMDLMQPATWATRLVEKSTSDGFEVRLRKEFVDDWRYIAVIERFVNLRAPKLLWTARQVNSITSAFADKCDVAKLLLRSSVQQIDVPTYHPPTTERIISLEGTTAYNTFMPSRITPQPGDPGLFLAFMQHLIPDEKERRYVLRWIATLIAKPSVRMGYAVILSSELHGTGKSTLASAILAPLVGEHNVSRPTPAEVEKASFNSWMKDKRLAIIDEVYQGHSWKVYNLLKPYITEKRLRVNEKFMAEVEYPCWIHFFATSNEMLAVRVDEGDRRWLIPRVTEELWKDGKFKELHAWLDAGGLEIIAQWAHDFGDYVEPGEHAPMTARKREMIASSADPKVKEALRIAEEMNAEPNPVALDRRSIDRIIESRLREVDEKGFASPQKVRKALEKGGLRLWERSMKIDDQKSEIFLSSHQEWDEILADSEGALAAVRQRLHKVKF